MSDVKMNSVLFAKKLRARKTELQAAHKVAMVKYDAAFKAWRLKLAVFLLAHVRSFAMTLTKERVYGTNSYGHGDYKTFFFKDAPDPPRRPNDEIVRKITARLNHIAITGQKTVIVTERDTREFFSDEPDDE